MPPFACPPIPFAGKQVGGVPPLGLGAPPGSLAPLAHTWGRGCAAPVSVQPPVHMSPLRAPPKAALPGVCLPGHPARNAEGRGCHLGLGAPPRLTYHPCRNLGGGGFAAPLCADRGRVQRVRGGYPFPAWPLACVSPLHANWGRRGGRHATSGMMCGPPPMCRLQVREGDGDQRGGALPILAAPVACPPVSATGTRRGVCPDRACPRPFLPPRCIFCATGGCPPPRVCTGFPCSVCTPPGPSILHTPTVRMSSRSAQRGARRGWYTSPSHSCTLYTLPVCTQGRKRGARVPTPHSLHAANRARRKGGGACMQWGRGGAREEAEGAH